MAPPKRAYADLRQVRVRCTNAACRAQASGMVPIREVVPGVLEMPRYVCASCGCQLKEDPR